MEKSDENLKSTEDSHEESSSTDQSYWCIEYFHVNDQLTFITKELELDESLSHPFSDEIREGVIKTGNEQPRIEHAHPMIVEKRNARERKRVKAVNEAFAKLRQMVPSVACRGKRVSKVKTLKKAAEYILELKRALEQNQTRNEMK